MAEEIVDFEATWRAEISSYFLSIADSAWEMSSVKGAVCAPMAERMRRSIAGASKEAWASTRSARKASYLSPIARC